MFNSDTPSFYNRFCSINRGIVSTLRKKYKFNYTECHFTSELMISTKLSAGQELLVACSDEENRILIINSNRRYRYFCDAYCDRKKREGKKCVNKFFYYFFFILTFTKINEKLFIFTWLHEDINIRKLWDVFS